MPSPDGSSVKLILIVLIILLFLSLASLLVLAWTGFLPWPWKNKAGKDDGGSNLYKCAVSGDCATLYNLGAQWICDPSTKTCRTRSYLTGVCKRDSDCMAATPSCVSTVNPPQTTCILKPYSVGTLFGDPKTSGCGPALGWNQTLNFCQAILGAACKSTDDCLNGSCVSGTCSYLGPYDKCTEGFSYGLNQCAPGLECLPHPSDPLLPSPQTVRRCQPAGSSKGQAGTYCGTDLDCTSPLTCYRDTQTSTYGVCASHVAQVGMDCKTDADCVPGLSCSPPALIIGGQGTTVSLIKFRQTCIFRDPAVQTMQTNCTQQYSSISQTNVGCARASFGTPCAAGGNSFCDGTLLCQGGVDALTIGFVNASQIWIPIYPSAIHLVDIYGIFSDLFFVSSDGVTIKSHVTLLYTPFMPAFTSYTLYPALSLGASPSEAARLLTSGAPTACPPPPLSGSLTTHTSYGSESAAAIMFFVKYDPAHPKDATVSMLVTGSGLSGDPSNQQIYIAPIKSKDLFAYACTTDSTPPYTNIYFIRNYHGTTTVSPYAMNQTELGDLPDWISSSSASFYLTPPPMLVSLSASSSIASLMSQTLHIPDGSQSAPTMFAHFFYYEQPGEKVVYKNFKTLTVPGGGGVSSLIGTYGVTTASGSTRVVVSTLAVYQGSNASSTFFQMPGTTNPNNNLLGVRKPIFVNTNTQAALFASVYSFSVFEFETNWPFMATLVGPTSTGSDMGGLMTVKSDSTRPTDPVIGIYETLNGNPAISKAYVPGYDESGTYPVFTPYSVTRMQAVSTPVAGISSAWSTASAATNPILGTRQPYLSDCDYCVTGTAGDSSIVSMVFLFQQTTFIMTMRFGDTTNVSAYSLTLVNPLEKPARTNMFTFHLTSNAFEAVGGIGSDNLTFFPPRVQLNPTSGNVVTSWITPGSKTDGTDIRLRSRTPWATEVFTLTIVPYSFTAPVRIVRMPNKNLSTESDTDDVWVIGSSLDNNDNLVAVPAYYDPYGLVVLDYISQSTGGSTQTWLATGYGLTTPQTTFEPLLTSTENTYTDLNTGNDLKLPSVLPPGRIPPAIVPSGDFPVPTLKLAGRMCETQGYEDGIIYRARPLFFPNDYSSYMPYHLLQVLQNFYTVTPDTLEELAIAVTGRPILETAPYLGLASISSLLEFPAARTTKTRAQPFPTIPGFFKRSERDVQWVSSSSSISHLPGGYRVVPCGNNPRALPFSTSTNLPTAYPVGCSDYVLTQGAERDARKPVPLFISYSTSASGGLNSQTYAYDLRLARGSNGTMQAQIFSSTLIQSNGGMIPFSQLGTNGGPVIVYHSCK